MYYVLCMIGDVFKGSKVLQQAQVYSRRTKTQEPAGSNIIS